MINIKEKNIQNKPCVITCLEFLSYNVCFFIIFFKIIQIGKAVFDDLICCTNYGDIGLVTEE